MGDGLRILLRKRVKGGYKNGKHKYKFFRVFKTQQSIQRTPDKIISGPLVVVLAVHLVL